MSNDFVRRTWRDFLWKARARIGYETDIDSCQRSAIVFSPHPDDETLGCGGLIIRKRNLGTPVTIVVMTNGGASHTRFMSRHELVAKRAEEAHAAARKLGVDGSSIIFLGFEDGRLSAVEREASQMVQEIINRERPDEVYIPYRFEPPSDHWSTNRIVATALRAGGWKPRVYEYPIWFWYHWPWVGIPSKLGRNLFQLILRTARSMFGSFVLRFRRSIDIADVLEIKKDALAQYESQMIKPLSGEKWPILPEISDGEFLGNFFQGYEVFHARKI